MRILHTMLRVTDLERSLRFYTEVLGMKLLRRKDYPDGRFTLAFVGYGEESEGGGGCVCGLREDPGGGGEDYAGAGADEAWVDGAGVCGGSGWVQD